MGTENLAEILSVLALLGALAFLVESVIEVVVASWLGRVVKEEDLRAMILKLLSSVVGVGLSVLIGIDLFAAVLGIFSVVPNYTSAAAIVGQVLTGLLMGRGAQWFHDIGSAWLGLDGNYTKERDIGIE
jgi:hypothetical protein